MRASTLFAALMILVPAAAQARPPLTVSAGYSSQVVTDRAWDLVDENDHLPMLRLGLGWVLDAPGGKLEVGAGFLTGTTGATLHQARNASLWLRGLELSATWRRPLARFFSPYARLGAGLDWATLSIGPDDALEQRDSAPSATGMLGFTIPIVSTQGDDWHEWLVFDLGVGYALRSAFDFDQMAPVGDEAAVAPAPINAGTLPTSGITYRIGFTVCL